MAMTPPAERKMEASGRNPVDRNLDANPQIRRNLQDNAGQYVKLGMVFVIALAIAAWYLFPHH